MRKAILKKQNYIELKDGSFGLLPEEWVAQYAQLFRFGKVDEKNILTTDRVHLNDAGNQLVADEMWAVLKTL